jgi:hypothetical protein
VHVVSAYGYVDDLHDLNRAMAAKRVHCSARSLPLWAKSWTVLSTPLASSLDFKIMGHYFGG